MKVLISSLVFSICFCDSYKCKCFFKRVQYFSKYILMLFLSFSNLNFATATCSEDDCEYGPYKKNKVARVSNFFISRSNYIYEIYRGFICFCVFV